MKKVLVLFVVLLVGSTALVAQQPSPEEVVALLGELRTELEWPGLTVEAAAKNLKTPQEALRFVRDEIVLVNYRGSYAGPEGVLRTRVANATDKAYLLAMLLGKMNVKVHLARSDWPENAQPHQGPGPGGPLPALKKLSALLGPGGAEAGASPDTMSDKQLQELRDEIKASDRAIENLLTAGGQDGLLKGSPAPGDTEPTRVDSDWVWVRAPQRGRLDGEAIQKSVLAEGGLLLASNDAPSSVWAIRPTGDLLGVFVDAPGGAAAKGAGRTTRSQAAGNAFAALGDGAMATLGCPAGMLIAPLHRYFEELAKAYNKAASVLDNLSKTIETGDDSHMKGNQDDYFKNLGGHLTNALTRGFVEGWAENAAGAGIGRVLGTTGSDRAVHRTIDGLVATNLSLPPESPVFPSVMRRAMEAVTIPTE